MSAVTTLRAHTARAKLRPIPVARFGDVPIEHPFTLAALSGYSDLAMRLMCRELGACFTRHEVVLDQSALSSGQGARSGKHVDDADHPIACQLMGAEPIPMAAAARKMVDCGYDVIDINFGCPVKKVLGRCRGGYLLGDPATAIEMLKRVKDAVKVPVTLKMRRGRDDSAESIEGFWQIAEAAVSIGIAGVVVHGRTVEQRYEGKANWDAIAAVKRRFPHWVVMGSGDLYTAEDCNRMLNETGCDGVTIARGAIENPWVFRDCLALWHGLPLPQSPSLEEQREAFDRQFLHCVQQYGEERASRQMRKFGIKRAKLHPDPQAVHDAFVGLANRNDWKALLDRHYPSSRCGSL